MKIVQSNAISLNGMLAKENGDEDWLPSEGWDEFIEDVKQFDNFIMGRETYDRVMELYPNYNFDNIDAKYKIIVTSQAGYKAPTGYVAASSPEAAKDMLAKAGLEVGLLIGGGKLNSSFYARGLVNEAWVTINPFILGKGRPFIGFEDIEIRLKLEEVIKLNKGRVQLRYSVAKSLE
jgi:dihydrofolate reductase